MTGLSRSTAGLDARQKRILFRSWHRGTREMDLLMGRFAESAIETMDESAMADFELLIEVPDRDLFAWLTEEGSVPGNYDTPVFRALLGFHRHDKPLDR